MCITAKEKYFFFVCFTSIFRCKLKASCIQGICLKSQCFSVAGRHSCSLPALLPLKIYDRHTLWLVVGWKLYHMVLVFRAPCIHEKMPNAGILCSKHSSLYLWAPVHSRTTSSFLYPCALCTPSELWVLLHTILLCSQHPVLEETPIPVFPVPQWWKRLFSVPVFLALKWCKTLTLAFQCFSTSVLKQVFTPVSLFFQQHSASRDSNSSVTSIPVPQVTLDSSVPSTPVCTLPIK